MGSTSGPEFEAELRAIIPVLPRAWECMKGLEWILARDPYAGYDSLTANVRYFPLQSPAYPVLYVFYTFGKATVWLLSVRRLDSTNGRAH
jgi:hypothetical protein